MAAHASCEVTEKRFYELIASAGLKVVKFWYPEGILNGVVEVVLDDEGAMDTNYTDEVGTNWYGEAGESNGHPVV